MVFAFLNFLMFDEIFLSPQVKRSVTISKKDGKYELPYEVGTHLIFRNIN